MGKLVAGRFGAITALPAVLAKEREADPGELVGDAPKRYRMPGAPPSSYGQFVDAVEQYREVHAAARAAWYVRKTRRGFHVRGFVLYNVPRGERVPKWWSSAVKALSRRSTRWKVQHWTDVEGTCYWRITWLRWRVYARG